MWKESGVLIYTFLSSNRLTVFKKYMKRKWCSYTYILVHWQVNSGEKICEKENSGLIFMFLTAERLTEMKRYVKRKKCSYFYILVQRQVNKRWIIRFLKSCSRYDAQQSFNLWRRMEHICVIFYCQM